MRRDVTLAVVLFVGTAALTIMQPIRPIGHPGQVLTAVPPTGCTRSVVTVGKPRLAGNQAVLSSDGLLAIHVCTRGTIRFALTGITLNGIGPNVVVMVGKHVVLSSYISGTIVISTPVDEGNWIEISFSNDSYLGPGRDRNLIVSRLTLNDKPLLVAGAPK